MVGKWFEIWFAAKQSMVETMRRNLQADLDAGYDPNGHCIRKQVVKLEEYERGLGVQLDLFKSMEDSKVNRWCYYDLLKRGAIEVQGR